MIPITAKSLDFKLPKKLECAKPSELRGIARDEVRLMVSNYKTDQIEHHEFKDLADVLQAGDVLVVNTSGTLKAALKAKNEEGKQLNVHLSTAFKNKAWIIELRSSGEEGSQRFNKAKSGEILQLEQGGQIQLMAPYYKAGEADLHLWIAEFKLDLPLKDYLDKFGEAIKYKYNKSTYPQAYYQTVFANEMGSAEMPSAGRAFSPELVLKLILKGVQILPILLHTGVASLELNEKPYDEYYEVSEFTAQQLNQARTENRRIIAVGTTVIRAIETQADEAGFVSSGSGWTDVFITPERGLRITNALLTGFHEPKASHLLMLETLSGSEHLEIAYHEAIKQQYLWHEFGDLHLLTR